MKQKGFKKVLRLTIALPQGLAVKLLVWCRLWLQVVDSALSSDSADLLVAQPNSACRVEVSLAARGFRECGGVSRKTRTYGVLIVESTFGIKLR